MPSASTPFRGTGTGSHLYAHRHSGSAAADPPSKQNLKLFTDRDSVLPSAGPGTEASRCLPLEAPGAVRDTKPSAPGFTAPPPTPHWSSAPGPDTAFLWEALSAAHGGPPTLQTLVEETPHPHQPVAPSQSP